MIISLLKFCKKKKQNEIIGQTKVSNMAIEWQMLLAYFPVFCSCLFVFFPF